MFCWFLGFALTCSTGLYDPCEAAVEVAEAASAGMTAKVAEAKHILLRAIKMCGRHVSAAQDRMIMWRFAAQAEAELPSTAAAARRQQQFAGSITKSRLFALAAERDIPLISLFCPHQWR